MQDNLTAPKALNLIVSPLMPDIVHNSPDPYIKPKGGITMDAHIHGGSVEVWQGRVHDAIVLVEGVPLDAKDVWLSEEVQHDAAPQCAVECRRLQHRQTHTLHLPPNPDEYKRYKPKILVHIKF